MTNTTPDPIPPGVNDDMRVLAQLILEAYEGSAEVVSSSEGKARLRLASTVDFEISPYTVVRRSSDEPEFTDPHLFREFNLVLVAPCDGFQWPLLVSHDARAVIAVALRASPNP